jgi:hypothetical protein
LINPYYADVTTISDISERKGLFSEAATEYQRAIENKPDRQAHFNLGRIRTREYQGIAKPENH